VPNSKPSFSFLCMIFLIYLLLNYLMTFMCLAYAQSNRRVQLVNWEEGEGGKKLGVFQGNKKLFTLKDLKYGKQISAVVSEPRFKVRTCRT
jgi:hypothetical protein